MYMYNIHGAESLPSLCVVFWQSLVSDEDTNQVLPETLDLAKGTRAEEVVSGSQDLRCSDGHGRLRKLSLGPFQHLKLASCVLRKICFPKNSPKSINIYWRWARQRGNLSFLSAYYYIILWHGEQRIILNQVSVQLSKVLRVTGGDNR